MRVLVALWFPSAAAAVHVAVVFAGKLGRINGKVEVGQQVDTTALRLAAYCWKRAVFDGNKNALAFVHSWDLEAKASIIKYLNPARAAFEPQIWFEEPHDRKTQSYVVLPSRPEKMSSFLKIISLWYSRMRALELVLRHEEWEGRKFDLVVLSRLDSCMCPDGIEGRPSGPLNLERYRLPADVQVGAYFMDLWSNNMPVGRDHVEHPGRPPFGGGGCTVGPGGTISGDVPRMGDSGVVGTSRALHKLASTLVYDVGNQTHWLGFEDPHAMLGIEMCRLFSRAQIGFANRSAYMQPANFLYWTSAEVIVREAFGADCLRAMQLNRVTARHCFERTCAVQPAPPSPPRRSGGWARISDWMIGY